MWHIGTWKDIKPKASLEINSNWLQIKNSTAQFPTTVSRAHSRVPKEDPRDMDAAWRPSQDAKAPFPYNFQANCTNVLSPAHLKLSHISYSLWNCSFTHTQIKDAPASRRSEKLLLELTTPKTHDNSNKKPCQVQVFLNF